MLLGKERWLLVVVVFCVSVVLCGALARCGRTISPWLKNRFTSLSLIIDLLFMRLSARG